MVKVFPLRAKFHGRLEIVMEGTGLKIYNDMEAYRAAIGLKLKVDITCHSHRSSVVDIEL